MSSSRIVPVAEQGRRGVLVKLRLLEVQALADIGGWQYQRLGDIIRDLLRMALAPRVAEISAARRAQVDWARQRFDDKLIRETAERTARRADPHTDADKRLVTDEPLGKIIANVPVSDRAAFARLALRRGTTMSALLRKLVRDALSNDPPLHARAAHLIGDCPRTESNSQ